MKTPGLKWKLTAFVFLLLASAVLALSILVLRGIRNDQTVRTEAEMKRQSDRAVLHIRQTYLTGDRVDPDAFMARQGQDLAVALHAQLGLPVILYDTKGGEAGNSVPTQIKKEDPEAIRYAQQGRSVYVTAGSRLEYLAPIRGPDGLLGVVQLELSILDRQEFYRYMVRLFLLVGGAVTAAALLLGYLFVSRQVAAIRRLTAAAETIRGSRFLQGPVLKRKDELGRLGEGIYAMSRTIERQIGSLQDERDKLRLAIVKLEALERQQKQFIGNISHEFKTPVTSIKAYADLLDMYGDDAELRTDASVKLGREADRLAELIDKVLQLARLEKYDFEYAPEPVEISAALREICGRLEGKAVKFGIAFLLALAPAVIWADRESLNHVFINLLDNAVKYNVPNGEVLVTTAVVGEQAEIRIADTGIGIPEALREKVFEPFFTVGGDRSRDTGGTGLGLSLVRTLVERQKGGIRLESGDPAGSVFTVSFPLYRTETGLYKSETS